MKRTLSLFLTICLLLGLLPAAAFAASGSLEITVPQAVTVKLTNAYAGTGTTITADSRSTSGGYRTYVFEDLSSGSYSITASGTDYYTLKKDIYYSSGTVVSMDVNPGLKTGIGWEASTGIERSDVALEEIFASTTSSWPGYEHIFDTPVFTNKEKGAQEFTTNVEMVDYLKALLPTCTNMYYFSLGTSPSYKHEMPLVVFTKTDLTGMSLKEAGAAVQANGKATVLHQAQIHGNEPAAGEGALALAGAVASGDLTDYNGGDILDSLNIMIIPRINPDGSRKFTRANVANGINMNRDYLAVQSVEVEAVIRAYNAFLPDVAIDAHEWTPNNTSETGVFDDLQLWGSGSLNNDAKLLDTSLDMMETVFDVAELHGIRPYFYQGNVTFGAGNNSIGPWYYGLRGTFGYCVETRGIGIGKGAFERRVFSQYLASESFLQYSAAHSQEIRNAVIAERERIAAVGESYKEDSVLVLKHGSQSFGKAYTRPTLNINIGKVTNPNSTATPIIYNVASKTRSRPTAYVLQAGTSNLSKVLATLDKHEITYIKLEEDTKLNVQQYSGGGNSASLGNEKSLTFKAGSYFLPMNQAGGNVLAMLMEPDVGDTASPTEALSTFVQKGVLSAASIYRYTGPLDQLGEREYTVNFCREDGSLLTGYLVKEGKSVAYSGALPTKAYTESEHYSFAGWVDSEGNPADLSNITADSSFYASFTAQAHSFSFQVTAEPTCTTEGTTLYSCTGCEKTYEESIASLGHKSELQNAKEPTCTDVGYSGDEVCTVCGIVVAKGNVLPTIEHSPVTIPGSPAGCLNSGLSDGAYCESCGNVLIAQQVLPRLGHSFRYTDNGDGTHSGSCERCQKALAATSHSYGEDGSCDLCGSGATPTVDESIVIRHSLELQSDISVHFVVDADTLQGYDSFYLECRIPQYEEQKLTGYSTVEIPPVLKGSRYYFTLDGMSAVQMGDVVKAKLYMAKGTETYCSTEDLYSVATYAYSQLEKQNASQQLKALCAELLRYGASAQSYKKYRTNALVDEGMTPEQRSYLVDLEAVTFGTHNQELDDLASPAVTWVGKSLDLASNVCIRFVVNAAGFEGDPKALSLKLSYKDLAGEVQEVELTQPTLYLENSSYYVFDFSGFQATELRTVMTAAVYFGEQRVSTTLEYGADSYGNGKTGELKTLCSALFAYSDAALRYFTEQ